MSEKVFVDVMISEMIHPQKNIFFLVLFWWLYFQDLI